MWGFVSILLALLFMFLPNTTDTPRSVSVDLPPAYHSTSMPGALREDAMQISITRDGKVFSVTAKLHLKICQKKSKREFALAQKGRFISQWTPAPSMETSL